jgi:hypothetical protein
MSDSWNLKIPLVVKHTPFYPFVGGAAFFVFTCLRANDWEECGLCLLENMLLLWSDMEKHGLAKD